MALDLSKNSSAKSIYELSQVEDGGGMAYVDRGDSPAHDFIREDFIADSSWHTLDLSSIVPEGTTSVHLRIQVKSILVNYSINFRKKGNVNEYNMNAIVIQVAGVQRHEDRLVACDSGRKIEYKVVGSNWEIINILVKGWFV